MLTLYQLYNAEFREMDPVKTRKKIKSTIHNITHIIIRQIYFFFILPNVDVPFSRYDFSRAGARLFHRQSKALAIKIKQSTLRFLTQLDLFTQYEFSLRILYPI